MRNPDTANGVLTVMRRRLMAVGVLAVLVMAGLSLAAGSSGTQGARAAADTSASQEPILGITNLEYADGGFSEFLSRLDPATVKPRGRRASVGEFHDTWSRSPDGRSVALGTGGQGVGIRIFDLAPPRQVRAVRTGIAAEGLAWLTPSRLVAVLQSNRLVVVNPLTGRVLRTRSLAAGERPCTTSPTAKSALPVAGGLLVLLRGRQGVAPRLLRTDAEARVRSVTLPRGTSWGCGRAGLAVSPDGRRAFIVSAGSEVAEVDLATMTATYHPVTGSPTRAARRRQVWWLASGYLVASGLDTASRPTGVTIIDTATWSSRVIDRAARIARTAAGLVLAYDGDAVGVARGRGSGVAVYGADGRRMFQLLRGTQINAVESVGTRAYAVSGRVVYTIDLAASRVTNRHTVAAARVSFTIVR